MAGDGLARGLGGELLAGGFASGGLAGGLLGTGHGCCWLLLSVVTDFVRTARANVDDFAKQAKDRRRTMNEECHVSRRRIGLRNKYNLLSK